VATDPKVAADPEVAFRLDARELVGFDASATLSSSCCPVRDSVRPQVHALNRLRTRLQDRRLPDG